MSDGTSPACAAPPPDAADGTAHGTTDGAAGGAPPARAARAEREVPLVPGSERGRAGAPPRRPTTGDAAPADDPRGAQWTAPIGILAPIGRDAAVAAAVLARAGFHAQPCGDMRALCAAIARASADGDARRGAPDVDEGARDDGIGALLVAEEALAGPAHAELLATLAAQPPWSDVPVVVLTGEGELSRALSPALETLTAQANVTLLERPVRVATLVTALRSALRARRRQLDVRDHLAERTAAEAALRAARQQAEHANQAKSEFLATMSHELRTPLNAIGGYAELLALELRGPLTDAQRQDLERLRRANQHMAGLVESVLSFARLDAGHVDYHVERMGLAPLVTDLEALVRPQLAAKGIRYDHDACGPDAPEQPHVVQADGEKVRQILLNLLTNAIKFTEPGGQVRLACETDAARGVVRVRVTDTGRGIAPDQLERIFEPFVQVDRHRTQASQQGVGLGLAISRELARGMGGDLTAESTPDVGSTFILALPTP